MKQVDILKYSLLLGISILCYAIIPDFIEIWVLLMIYIITSRKI